MFMELFVARRDFHVVLLAQKENKNRVRMTFFMAKLPKPLCYRSGDLVLRALGLGTRGGGG